MNKLLLPAMTLALVTLAQAQTAVTFPNTLPGSYSANSWPFNNTATSGFRTQFIYDGSMLGVNYPVLIQRLRFRRSSTSTTTGSQTQVTCSLSTSPVKWNALTTTFANQVGKDVKQIFKGTMQFNATPWYVDIKLKVPFLYDPSKGDLCFDFIRASGGVVTSPGPGGYHRGTAAAPFKANRVYGSPGSPTGRLNSGSAAANGYANACEVTFLPAKGLYAGFVAKPVLGKSPLKVQFTDKSYSSDAGGVKSWAWDFNGDNKIDSTLQNPTYTYTASAFDTYFDVSLTVTDAAHPKNTLTMKKFIRVNPSTAREEDFGKGTFNKSAPSPILMPKNTNHFISRTVRGFHFQAPGLFIVNGFECPNDHATKQTDQTVSVYRLKAAPPSYPTTLTPTAADLVFHGTGKAGTVLRPKAPIIFKKGEHFAILGACHSGATGNNYNSYGQGGWKTTVLKQPITCNRLIMQTDHKVNKGLGPIADDGSSFSIARVWVHVLGNTSTLVPELTSSARPILGTTTNLEFTGNLATAQAGVLFLGVGRMPVPIPTPFGSLLIKPPFLMNLVIPGGKGTIPVPIPNNNSLKGVVLDWQALVFDIPGGYFGMSNGTEWYLGLK
ncbi:MAG: hypothetical protein CSA62_04980 [Planctomycetota bacterium]|nr:MAG: hypothetical protein CSA62_04980 [Planctomycetota bacterium]